MIINQLLNIEDDAYIIHNFLPEDMSNNIIDLLEKVVEEQI